MENASKALIIAGAILLSILIISLGLMVFQNAKNTVGGNNLNKQEIEAFNSQWENYLGSNKTASEVRSLCQSIIASNAAETNTEKKRYIKVTGSNTASISDPESEDPKVKMPSRISKFKDLYYRSGLWF